MLNEAGPLSSPPAPQPASLRPVKVSIQRKHLVTAVPDKTPLGQRIGSAQEIQAFGPAPPPFPSPTPCTASPGIKKKIASIKAYPPHCCKGEGRVWLPGHAVITS